MSDIAIACFFFRKACLTEDMESAARTAVARLSSLAGDDFQIARYAFGRARVCTLKGALLVEVTTARRPAERACIAIVPTATPETLVPSHDQRDFQSLCNLLGVTSQADRNRVAQLVGPSLVAPR